MASHTCWRCLARPTRHIHGLSSQIPRSAVVVPILPAASNAFSTTIPREGKALRLKKRKIAERAGKPPAPGERKAIRKMIVLSNTNALAISDLEEMTAENISSVEHRGRVLAIPDEIVSQLRAAESFQTKQRWRLFRKPSVVMRQADVRLAQMMDDVKSSKRVIRQVMVGQRGSGKSLYLLQATAAAMLKGWIVITIPEAQDLVNSNTAYEPVLNIRPIVYQQKAYTASLLQRIINANPQLADLKTTIQHELPISVPENISLAKFAHLGVNDPALAHAIFQALMKELTAPGRAPLLITMDGFNHANKISAYRSSSFELIHAHDIYLPAWFIACLSGNNALPNGGAVLAAMTRSNGPHVRSLEDRLDHLEKQQAVLSGTLSLKPEDNITLPYLQATGQEDLATQVPDLDAFVRYDERVLRIFANTTSDNLSLPGSTTGSAADPDSTNNDSSSTASQANETETAVNKAMSEPNKVLSWANLTPATSNVEVKRFTGLTKMEAKALMEYWARSGILRAEVSERFVGEAWSVAGGGLPGELERTCLGMRY